jgi:hypothetical protein
LIAGTSSFSTASFFSSNTPDLLVITEI